MAFDHSSGPAASTTRGTSSPASGTRRVGDSEHGIWSAGQVQGLIRAVPTCVELVQRIVNDVDTIIDRRLARIGRAEVA